MNIIQLQHVKCPPGNQFVAPLFDSIFSGQAVKKQQPSLTSSWLLDHVKKLLITYAVCVCAIDHGIFCCLLGDASIAYPDHALPPLPSHPQKGNQRNTESDDSMVLAWTVKQH